MQRPFEFTGRIRSFKYAFAGLWVMLKTQHNAWIHFVATLITIALAVVYQLTTVEWCFIILAIVSVWMAEALNTAFEFLADVTTPEFHPLVKMSKDVAAGAVLLAAIGAFATGLIVFGPKILSSIF